MDTRDRADLFTRYVGLELKGKITSRGFTALAVATTMGRSPAAFNRWLNGKAEIPLPVLCEASEVIGVEPTAIVSAAYDRLAYEHGEIDGTTYEQEQIEAPIEVTDLRDVATLHLNREDGPSDERLAAKRARRKADQDHAE